MSKQSDLQCLKGYLSKLGNLTYFQYNDTLEECHFTLNGDYGRCKPFKERNAFGKKGKIFSLIHAKDTMQFL